MATENTDLELKKVIWARGKDLRDQPFIWNNTVKGKIYSEGGRRVKSEQRSRISTT